MVIAAAFAAALLLACPTWACALETTEGDEVVTADSVVVPEPSQDVVAPAPSAPSDEDAKGEDPTPVLPTSEDEGLSADAVDQDGGPAVEDPQQVEEPTDAPKQADENTDPTSSDGQADDATVPADTAEQPTEDTNPSDPPTSVSEQGGETEEPTIDAPAAPVAQAVKDGLYELTSALGKTLRLEATTSSSGSVTPKTKAATNAASQRWRVKSVGSGFYTLQNVATGTYLQAPAKVTSKSAALTFGKADGSEVQQWSITTDPARAGYLIVWSRAYPDMVLHIASASAANGSSVRLYRANGTAAQSFGAQAITRVIDDGFYVITNKRSGQALHVQSSSLKNNANVQQWTRNKSLAQTFKLTYNKSTGYYSVINVQSGKALEVTKGQSADGTNIQQNQYKGTRAQQWCIKRQTDGSLKLFSAIDGRALSVKGGSLEKGANVQTYHACGSAGQRWFFTAQSNWLPAGTYEIVADVNTANALSMGKSIASGAKGVTAARGSADTSARWQLVWMGEGCARLINLKSGYALTVGSTKASEGARVVQRKWSGAKAQQWRPVFKAGGILLQSALDGGISLDICNGSRSVGVGVQTSASTGAAAQRFHFVRQRAYELNTPYVIRSVSTRTGVVNIKKAGNAAGVAAQLEKADATTAQVFVFVNAGGGLVRIRNVKSEKYLARTGKGTWVAQVASATGDDTKWRVSFDSDINALRIETPSKDQSLSASPGLSKSLRCPKVSGASASEGFVLGVDANVLVDQKTGKAARSKRVYVSGRGWFWADDTCKLRKKVTVDVPYVNQYDYGAIMGCEGAALYMCLRQAGYCENVSYTQFLKELVRSPNGDPNLGFVGSPWVITGNVDGVLPKGAVLWVNKYAKGHDVSGIGATGLFNLLSSNKPIAVWVTPHFRASYATRFYGVTVPNSWHCVTLTGYDPKTNKLRIADPASDDRVYWVTWDTFFSKWNMGQNAVTVS